MIRRTIQLAFEHRVIFTRDAFAPANEALADVIREERERGEGAARLLVCVDRGVVDSFPAIPGRIREWCHRRHGLVDLVADPIVVPGGEAAKNDWTLVERLLAEINRAGLDRHAYVVAVGGGAVLDLVGFAAAVAHRGIRHIRFPTTTLSQGDGGVGVKNGVNRFGKKNWLGTFAVPSAVINDLDFLGALPAPEMRAGLIEAIKVAAIRDREFFETIEALAPALARLDPAAVERVIRGSAERHVDHIATSGDPFESGSARPLDFGHWVAHKLEQVSGFEVGHGEAVAVGMAVDLLYSVRIGLLAPPVAERILRLMEAVGFDLHSDHLAATDGRGERLVLRGLEEFREHLGGRLTITLVPEIGSKVEVHEMDLDQVNGALQDLENRRLRRRPSCGETAESLR